MPALIEQRGWLRSHFGAKYKDAASIAQYVQMAAAVLVSRFREAPSDDVHNYFASFHAFPQPRADVPEALLYESRHNAKAYSRPQAYISSSSEF